MQHTLCMLIASRKSRSQVRSFSGSLQVMCMAASESCKSRQHMHSGVSQALQSCSLVNLCEPVSKDISVGGPESLTLPRKERHAANDLQIGSLCEGIW